jgi:hypothetical protein
MNVLSDYEKAVKCCEQKIESQDFDLLAWVKTFLLSRNFGYLKSRFYGLFCRI